MNHIHSPPPPSPLPLCLKSPKCATSAVILAPPIAGRVRGHLLAHGCEKSLVCLRCESPVWRGSLGTTVCCRQAAPPTSPIVARTAGVAPILTPLGQQAGPGQSRVSLCVIQQEKRTQTEQLEKEPSMRISWGRADGQLAPGFIILQLVPKQ